MNNIMKTPQRCPHCGNPLFDCDCKVNTKVLAKLDEKNRNKYVYLDDVNKYRNWVKIKCKICKDIVGLDIKNYNDIVFKFN